MVVCVDGRVCVYFIYLVMVNRLTHQLHIVVVAAVVVIVIVGVIVIVLLS